MARRKKPAVKPRKMKHRSTYVTQKTPENSVVVSGDAEETVTGAVIPGTTCKGYEQYYEYMEAGAATAILSHEKKTRTIMVVAGAGFAHKTLASEEEDGTDLAVEEPLAPGNVVEFPPGVPYRISATAASQLEFFVVQEKAYRTHMKSEGEATEGEEPVVEETPEHLQTTAYQAEVAREQPTPRRPRGQSKAAQQNQKFRGGTNAGVHITRLLGSQAAVHQTGAQAANTGSSHATGVNPMPTNG